MPGFWQDFFHAPVDLSSLAVVRILLGALVVCDAVSYARSASTFLHPDGLLPFEVWKRGPDGHFFSLLRWLPASTRSVTVLIVLNGLAGACLSVGLGTSWAAAAAFVTGVSLQYRNRFALHSGDALLRVLLLLLVFSDAGRVWSVDAALDPPATALGTAWPLRLMQLQVAQLYLWSVWHKRTGKTWKTGSATHYATRLLAHRRRRLPARLDGAGMHRAATYATLAVELAGATLIWFEPARYFVIAGLAALHLSLQYLMRMHLFQWIMLASLILFVPGEVTANLLKWR